MAAEFKMFIPKTKITKFPNQHFSEKSGKLFCDACREILPLKKSMLTQHIKSAKHLSGLKNLESKSNRQKNILDILKTYDQAVHPSGEKLPEAVQIIA